MTRTMENPFGSPDGSRVDIDELFENFVSFSEREFYGGIATRPDDRTARIIIGRKGSGKTAYLRRLQAEAKAEESLYVDRIARDGLSTEDVLTFSQLFTVNLLEENWTKLWYCAIICSVTSHLMFSPRLRDKLPDDLRAELLSTFKPILLPTSVPLTPYQAASQIINNNSAKNRIERYFHSNLWSQLEWHLCEHLAGLPPLCFFLDAVDEEFAYAPMYWLQAQKGLFLRTIKFLRHQHFGGRLHIFICIREIVLSSVLQGDNASRYLGEPSIRVLKWNMSAIEVFLKEKLAMLDDIHFIANGPLQGRTCASWLGRDTITDTFSQSREPLLNYLLRHTRLLPRDTIILGNNLASKVHEARDRGHRELTEESIRQVVADTAHHFAHEQIFICGKQLAADLMPERAVQHGYSSFFVGSAAYANDISEKFRELIGCLRYHMVSYADLQAAQELAFDSFGDGQIDPLSILWQNGLLGYVEPDLEIPAHIYYSEDRLLDFKLPAGKGWYTLHPCLLKTLGLKHHPQH